MATALQWLAGQPVRRTVVIAGPDTALQRLALEMLEVRASVERRVAFTAPQDTAEQVLLELAAPSQESRLVIWQDVHRASRADLASLLLHVEHPADNTTLCLTAATVRNADKERWIPSNPRVLYVDCGHLDRAGVARLGRLRGLSEDDAVWLADRCHGDVAAVVRVLDVLTCYRQPWPAGLVRSLCPHLVPVLAALESFDLPDTADDVAFCRAFQRRLEQLITIAAMGTARLPSTDVSQRTGIPAFLLPRLYPVAGTRQVHEWTALYAAAGTAEHYARLGVPGVREFMAIHCR